MKRAMVGLALAGGLLLASCASNSDLYAQSVVLSHYLTATSEVEVVKITQTAAALSVRSTELAVDATSTAMYYTPTPAPTATPNVTATYSVSMLHAQETQMALASDRARLTNDFLAVLPGLTWVTFVVILALAALAARRLLRFRPAPTNPQGEVIPVMDTQTGALTSPNRMANYRGQMDDDLLREALRAWLLRRVGVGSDLPLLTAERQDATTTRAQMVELARTSKRLPAQTAQPAPSAASLPAELPERVEFPGVTPGRVLLGATADGKVAGGKWGSVGHIIVAGQTGSGKSVTVRSVVHQAQQQGFGLLLGDLDGATFPMLAGSSALLAPLAGREGEYVDILGWALEEIERRAKLYADAPGYPESVEEYNQSNEPLKRILIALDEYNAAVTATGGPDGDLARLAAGIAWRGRKFGITLLFAAQDFSKGVIGRVRDQAGAIVAHRVRSVEVARNLGLEGAARISERTPGRALTDRWGVIQSYFVGKSRLIGAGSAQQMTLPLPTVTPERTLTNVERLAQGIQDKYQPGMSARSVASLLGKQYAGSWYYTANAVLKVLEAASTATTTPTTTLEGPKMAVLAG